MFFEKWPQMYRIIRLRSRENYRDGLIQLLSTSIQQWINWLSTAVSNYLKTYWLKSPIIVCFGHQSTNNWGLTAIAPYDTSCDRLTRGQLKMAHWEEWWVGTGVGKGTEDALHSRTESLSTKALLQAAWAFLLHGGWLLRMSVGEPDRRCTAHDAQVINLTWCHFRPSLKLPKAKEREYRAICEWESVRLHHEKVMRDGK